MRSLAQSILSLDIFDGEKFLKGILDSAIQTTGCRHALLAVYSEADGRLEIQCAAGPEASRSIGYQIEVGESTGIIAYVAAAGQMYKTGNVEEEARYKKIFDSTVSEIAVPIRDQSGRITAVLNLESDIPDAFGPSEEAACLVMAKFATAAFELERRRTREAALTQIGHALDYALTEESLISEVVHVAAEVLLFQAASIFIRETASNSFVLRGSTSRLNAEVGRIRYQADEGCTGWVCGNGKSILLQNPQSDPRWRGKYVEFASDQIASFLCVPILVSGKSEGAIRIIRRVPQNEYIDNRFTEDDLQLMEAIAEQVGSGLQNIRSVERLLRSERMIAWGELSAKSSHMIGNRVFAVRGDINELKYLLDEDHPSVSDLQAAASSLETNVTRIEEILQDFRDFISATQLNTELADLTPIIEETVREVFPKRTPVKRTVSIEPNLPQVNVDRKRFRRALSELIENSLMFAAENDVSPELTVGARRRSSESGQSREYVEVFVADTGPGVPVEDKRRIFEPFYSGRVKGMGLGLSIVKGITEAHGGEVAEIGEQGKGATFVMRLPVQKRP